MTRVFLRLLALICAAILSTGLSGNSTELANPDFRFPSSFSAAGCSAVPWQSILGTVGVMAEERSGLDGRADAPSSSR